MAYRFNRHDVNQKPDIVLRKATQLYEEDQKDDALTLLINIIAKNKIKYRQWQNNAHPEIFELYIKICVEKRKSQVAKDGLYQCKAMTQHSHPDELETVIQNYLNKAHEQAKKAKKASKDSLKELSQAEDLDNMYDPEQLLNSVTASTDEDRAEKLHYLPWFKFLWDAHKQALDVLSWHNVKLEPKYRDVAFEACKIAVENNRINDFRRLSETLRNHLRQMTDTTSKSQRRENQVCLYAPTPTEQIRASQVIQTEIRHKMLETAISLRMWADAHKTIEDIFLIQQFTRRDPKSYANTPKFHSKFLNLISKVFENSGHDLLHAATRHKIFRLTRDMKQNTTAKELVHLRKLAAQTLVATLSIKLTEKIDGLSKYMYEVSNTSVQTDKYVKWYRFLGYERMPTRQQLVNEIKYNGVMQNIPEELIILYKNLEDQFNPLRLASRVDNCLKWLNDEKNNELSEILKPYAEKLQHVTASRIISQISNTYETIDFDRISKLVPFYDSFELEQHILDDCRSGRLRAKLDHATSTITFGSCFDPAPLLPHGATGSENLLTDGSQEKDWLNSYLNQVHGSLTKASVLLRPLATRQKAIESFQSSARHFAVNDDRSRHEFKKRAEKFEAIKNHIQNKHDNAERKREEDAAKKAEAEKRAKEEQEEALRKAKDAERAKEAKEKNIREFITQKLTELKTQEKMRDWCEHLEPEDLITQSIDYCADKQVDGLRKQKIEQKKALGRREDEKDYHERAKRQVEKHHREANYEARLKKKLNELEAIKQKTLNDSKAKYEEEKANKEKFIPREQFIADFTVQVEEKAIDDYNVKISEFNDMKSQAIEEKKYNMEEEHINRQLNRWKDKVNEMKTMVANYKDWEMKKKREEKHKEQLAHSEKLRKERELEAEARRPSVSRPVDERPSAGERPRRFIGNKSNDNNKPLNISNTPKQDDAGFARIRGPDPQDSWRKSEPNREPENNDGGRPSRLRFQGGPKKAEPEADSWRNPRNLSNDRNPQRRPSAERDAGRFGPPRRRDDDRSPPRRRDDDRPFRRRDDDRDGPIRRRDDDRDGPIRRRDDDGPRGFGGPRRNGPGGDPRDRSPRNFRREEDGPPRRNDRRSPRRDQDDGGWRRNNDGDGNARKERPKRFTNKKPDPKPDTEPKETVDKDGWTHIN